MIIEKNEKSFAFKEDEDETYFNGKISRSIIEYEKDKMLVCLKNSSAIYCIDRKKKDVVKKIKNPTGDTNCFSLCLIPEFSSDMLPFALLRDRKGVSLLNLKSGKSYILFACIFNYEPGNTKRLETYRDPNSGLV